MTVEEIKDILKQANEHQIRYTTEYTAIVWWLDEVQYLRNQVEEMKCDTY